jgi:hypothetical protein
MTHPEELLAGYEDGTLSPQDRAAVERHLTSCRRCSRDVELASDARTALRDLASVPAPAGIADLALAEAGVRAAKESQGAETPRWYRWGGIAAAVAATLLVLTLVLPKIGGTSGSADRAAQPAAAEGTGPNAAPVRLEITHTNYDSDSLTTLATDFAAAKASTGVAPEVPGGGPTFASEEQTRKAAACIQKSWGQLGSQVRLLQASFGHEPAYLGFYEQGPGEGQPTNAVMIAVVSAGSCNPLSLTSARLPT